MASLFLSGSGRVIPGADHFWSREQPEVFTRTFLEWALNSTSAD
jgi:hypothetical protein